jgi:hypothetical protein
MQVKHAVLLSATEAAEMILRVDEIIKGNLSVRTGQADPCAVVALLLPSVPARLTFAPPLLQRHHGSGKSRHAIPQRDQSPVQAAVPLECQVCSVLQSAIVASVICLRNLGSVESVVDHAPLDKWHPFQNQGI